MIHFQLLNLGTKTKAEDGSEAKEDVLKKPSGKELKPPESMDESDEEEDVIDIGLLSRPTGTYSDTDDRIEQHLVYKHLKTLGYTMDRDDEAGWGLMYKIITGSEWSHATRRCISSYNKYYKYQHGGERIHLGYDIHPFDQKNTRDDYNTGQTVRLSINEVTAMCKVLGNMIRERYGIDVWTTPRTFVNGLASLDERWKELAVVLAKVAQSPQAAKNKFMIKHLRAETGWVPRFSEQQWAALDATPARQTEAFGKYQVFVNILVEVGGGDVSSTVAFPSEKEIPKVYGQWLEEEENLVHKDAKEASRRLSSEQYKLVAAVSNNFNPDPELVKMIDTLWVETAFREIRDFREFLFDLRYKYGKNETPIPPELLDLVKEAQKHMNMFLMMFDLDHHSDVAVEQKRRDQVELGRSQPCMLNSQELYERAHLFSLLQTSVHMIKTLGEVPALLDPTRTQRNRHIMYKLVVALEKHVLGEECTMSRIELPDHVLEGHHDAEQYDIREGDTVHPTAKVCGRGGLYNCRMEYVSWSTRLFIEVGKKTRLSREWHRFTHFVLRNLDWFNEHFEIDYPYEVDGDKLVRR